MQLTLLVSAAFALPQLGPPSEPGAFYWADFDRDGHTDAYVVLPGGRAKLLAGQGEGRFRDVTRESGLERIEGIRQAQWADFDGDGHLDLFLAGWEAPSQLLLQDPQGGFVAGEAGAWSELPILDVRALDFDGDRIADLQLVTSQGDRLLRGLGAARFEAIELGFETAAPLQGALLSFEDARREAGLDPLVPGDEGDTLNMLPSSGAVRVPTPDSLPAGVFCPPAMEDSATGSCLPASSVPTLGALYPLGTEFYIQAGSGNVGIGTTSPGQALDVVGSVRASGRLISDAPSGPPLEVQSSTRVNNLNADLLDGFTASDFSQLGSTIDGSELANNSVTTTKIAPGAVESSDIAAGAVTEGKLAGSSVTGAKIQNGTITDVDVSSSAAIQGTKIVAEFGAQTILGLAVSVTNVFATTVNANIFDANFGTTSTPTYRFAEAEPTGLASPFTNTLNLITNGISRAVFGSDGSIDFGSPRVMSIETDGRVLISDVSGALYQKLLVRNDQSATAGSFSTAVNGENEATSNVTLGVSGKAASNQGIGVNGWASSTSGECYGVRGDLSSNVGAGVRGRAFTNNTLGELANATGYGVLGVTSVAGVPAIRGISLSSPSFGDGVYGETSTGAGYGIWGVNNFGGFGVYASGNMGATGTKSFVAPHPADPASEIRFVCLEGNEAGTYFRGSSETIGGVAIIDVPAEFRHVTDSEGITVQVTARGPGQLWVESEGLDQIVVRSNQDVAFHYFVNGVRRGFQDVEIVAENRAYRPTEAGVPFGAGLPDEVRQLLVDNGILNPDFTPNEATAASLGWSLRPQGTSAQEREGWQAPMQPLPQALPAPERTPVAPR